MCSNKIKNNVLFFLKYNSTYVVILKVLEIDQALSQPLQTCHTSMYIRSIYIILSYRPVANKFHPNNMILMP